MRKSKWIRILTAIGVVFLIVFVVIPPFTRKWYRNHSTKYAPPVPTSKWKKFSSAEGNFSIWFPGIPQSTNFTQVYSWSNDEKSVEISTDLHEFYVSPNVQNIFTVAYCDHSMFAKIAASTNSQAFFKKSQALLVSEEEGKIVFEQESKFRLSARELNTWLGKKPIILPEKNISLWICGYIK